MWLAIGFTTLALADDCVGVAQSLGLISKELAHNNFRNAERMLLPLETSHPECADAVLAKARLQAAQGEATAEDTFVRYNNLRPRDAEGYAYYARFLLDEGQYQRADAVSTFASDLNPEDSVAMSVRGQILNLKGNSHDGIVMLKRACELDPDDAESRFQLGVEYDQAKLPDRAVAYFSEEVALDPMDSRGWDYLALNLESLGQVDRAEDAYKKGLAANRPGAHFDAFLPYNYGRFLMKRNDLSSGKEQLDRAVKLTPQVRAPWYERARLNLRMGKYREARYDAENAINIRETQGVIADLQVYSLLQQIYLRLGEIELARKYAELSRTTPAPIVSDVERTQIGESDGDGNNP